MVDKRGPGEKNIPSDILANFTTVNQQQSKRLQQTPSTGSLLRLTTSRLFAPKSTISRMKRKKEGKFVGHLPHTIKLLKEYYFNAGMCS